MHRSCLDRLLGSRLGLMVDSDSQYLFWHMGPGLWIVKIVMLAAVLGLLYLGLRPVQKPKPESPTCLNHRSNVGLMRAVLRLRPKY
jgi:hypothetical protein